MSHRHLHVHTTPTHSPPPDLTRPDRLFPFLLPQFVSRSLMMVAHITEKDASDIMMQASWQGGALVGTWEEAVARHTHEGMKKAGLNSSIRPADEKAREVNMFREDPFFPDA